MNPGVLDSHASNWNAMAELDPLWAILSDPEKKFGRWDPQEFFRDGEREAKRVTGMCEANGVGVSYGKMLDFGCGAGSMTRAFSQILLFVRGDRRFGENGGACKEIQCRSAAM
jgi:hypothetical protein